MKIIKISIITLLIILQPTFAKLPECEKAKIKSLKIGYTYGPDSYVKKSLKKYAKLHGLKLTQQLLDLNELNKFNTFIIPGGIDIHPKYYWNRISEKAKTEIKPLLHLVDSNEEGEKRDQAEMLFIDTYLDKSKREKLAPLVGICRGMQILLASQGVPLYIDIKTQLGIPNRIGIKEKIEIKNLPQTHFYKIFGKFDPSFYAMEWHHQGGNVKYLSNFADKFYFTSFSNNDMILESFEFKDLPILGVQFHPEGSKRNIEKPFFESILNQACKHKQ
ncbi:gamma-glutamyl-gamma-aminobutyrate hydrolase family protein [Bacteriovoracaceae bacterium]|nr:gamma-glutamyl-gamma-aminobutyrate hydrolase family protein [Bacteriovoracaceae bacterium]